MKKYTLVITCQFYENKAWYEGGFAWAPKGGSTFHVKIDMDDWTYYSDKVRDAIAVVVASKDSNVERNEIVDIELIFDEPVDITKEFDALYSAATVDTQDYI